MKISLTLIIILITNISIYSQDINTLKDRVISGYTIRYIYEDNTKGTKNYGIEYAYFSFYVLNNNAILVSGYTPKEGKFYTVTENSQELNNLLMKDHSSRKYIDKREYHYIEEYKK